MFVTSEMHCFFFSEHFLASRYVENPSTVLDAEKVIIDNG